MNKMVSLDQFEVETPFDRAKLQAIKTIQQATTAELANGWSRAAGKFADAFSMVVNITRRDDEDENLKAIAQAAIEEAKKLFPAEFDLMEEGQNNYAVRDAAREHQKTLLQNAQQQDDAIPAETAAPDDQSVSVANDLPANGDEAANAVAPERKFKRGTGPKAKEAEKPLPADLDEALWNLNDLLAQDPANVTRSLAAGTMTNKAGKAAVSLATILPVLTAYTKSEDARQSEIAIRALTAFRASEILPSAFNVEKFGGDKDKIRAAALLHAEGAFINAEPTINLLQHKLGRYRDLLITVRGRAAQGTAAQKELNERIDGLHTEIRHINTREEAKLFVDGQYGQFQAIKAGIVNVLGDKSAEKPTDPYAIILNAALDVQDAAVQAHSTFGGLTLKVKAAADLVRENFADASVEFGTRLDSLRKFAANAKVDVKTLGQDAAAYAENAKTSYVQAITVLVARMTPDQQEAFIAAVPENRIANGRDNQNKGVLREALRQYRVHQPLPVASAAAV